jgi:hypothetical protein
MIYEEMFKGVIAWLGLPAAVIIAVVIGLDFGLTPIDTVAMKIEKASEGAAEALKGEHIVQAEKLILQTRELQVMSERNLSALKEICFNTAQNDSARRRCGGL